MAALPINVDSVGFRQGMSDVKQGITSILGPLNIVTARMNLLQAGIFGVGAAAAALGVLGLVKLTRKIIDLNKEMVRLAASAEEIRSRFGITFGGNAEELASDLDLMATAMGRANLELQRGASDLGQFFVSMDLSRESAAEFSKIMTRTAIDVASFQDRADADVLRRFKSALVGNSEAVRELGLNLQENTLRQLAWNEGLTDSERQLSANEKVIVRMLAILKQTGDAQNDAIRTQDSLANIQKRLNAEYRESLDVFGKGVTEVFREFLVEGVGVYNIMALIRLAIQKASLAGIAFIEVLNRIGSAASGFEDQAKFIRLFTRNAANDPNPFIELAGAGLNKYADILETIAGGMQTVKQTGEDIRLDVLSAQLQSFGVTAEEVNKIIEHRIENLGMEKSFVADLLQARLDRMLDAENRKREQNIELLKQQFRAAAAVATQQELAKQEAKNLLSGTFTGAGIVGLRTAFDGFSTAIGDAAAGLRDFGETSKQVFQQVVSDITAALVRAFLLRNVIAPIFGGGAGASYGALVAQALGFRAAAKGMVQPFAAGGFPMGAMNGPVVFGLAGERGGASEAGFGSRHGKAIAPLEKDPTSGALGVRVVGRGGQGSQVNITNNFGTAPSTDRVRRSSRQLEMQLMASTQRGRI